jgi:hypothetical protein
MADDDGDCIAHWGCNSAARMCMRIILIERR